MITVTSPDQIPKGAPADVKEHLESAPTTAANENPTAAATEKAAEEHPLPQMPTNATTTDTAQTREANVDQHKPDTAMAVNADGSVSMTDSSRTATPQAPADAKESVRAQTVLFLLSRLFSVHAISFFDEYLYVDNLTFCSVMIIFVNS